MHSMRRLLIGLCLWLSGQCLAVAEPIEVESVRFMTEFGHTQVVFDVSGQPLHVLTPMENPDRVVVSLSGARMADSFSSQNPSGGVVKGIRSGINKQDLLYIVLDLKQGVGTRSFVLKPKYHYGYRLVIDLFTKEEVAGGNMQKVVSTKMHVDTYTIDRAINDGVKGGLLGLIIAGLLVLVRSGYKGRCINNSIAPRRFLASAGTPC